MAPPALMTECASSNAPATTETPSLHSAYNPQNDIGLYINYRNMLDDDTKFRLLTDPYIPPDNYDWPVDHRLSRGKQESRFLRRDHLTNPEHSPWISYSHSQRGVFCRVCVLFPSDGVAKRTPQKLRVFVTEPFIKFARMKGRDGYVGSHIQSEYHQISLREAMNFKTTYLSLNPSAHSLFNTGSQIQGHYCQTSAGANTGDLGASSSFDQSGVAEGPVPKRMKQIPAKEVNYNKGQHPSAEFAKLDSFAQNQAMMRESVDDAYIEEEVTIECYNNDGAFPKKRVDNDTSKSDEALATLVRNQQQMLDAMQRLERKLNSVQQSQADFNKRLTAMEKQTHAMTRQAQKSLDALETKLNNFIAAYSNNGNNDSMLSATASWNHVAAITDVIADVDAAYCSSFSLAADEDPVSYETRELQQQLDVFCSSSKTTNKPRYVPATSLIPYRRGNQRPGAKLALDPNDTTIGWIGGNPDLPIPVSEYSKIWSKSSATELQMLFALLYHVYGGPQQLKHLSWSGKDGRQPLKDDPALAACAAQVSLQFPTFEMTSAVGIKVADRLHKLRIRHASPTPIEVPEDGAEEGCYNNSTEFSVEDAVTYSELPVAVEAISGTEEDPVVLE